MHSSYIWIHPHYRVRMVFVQRGNLVSLMLDNLLLLGHAILWASSLLLQSSRLRVWLKLLCFIWNRCLIVVLSSRSLHDSFNSLGVINDKVINVIVVDNIRNLVCFLLVIVWSLSWNWLLWFLFNRNLFSKEFVIVLTVLCWRSFSWVYNIICLSSWFRSFAWFSVRIWRNSVAVLAALRFDDLGDHITFLTVVLIYINFWNIIVLWLSSVIYCLLGLLFLIKHVGRWPVLFMFGLLFLRTLGLFRQSRHFSFNYCMLSRTRYCCWSISLDILNSCYLSQSKWPGSQWSYNISSRMMRLHFWNFFLLQ